MLQSEGIENRGAKKTANTIHAQHKDGSRDQDLVLSKLGELEGEAAAGQVRSRQEVPGRH